MKSERQDWFRFHACFLIIILLVVGNLMMFVVYHIATQAERKSMEMNAGQTLDFLQSVCQKYDDYQLGNTTRDLQSTIGKVRVIRDYGQYKEITSDAYLLTHARNQNLTGIFVLNKEKEIIAHADRRGNNAQALLDTILSESNAESILRYPKKVYADQTAAAGCQYNYAILSLRDQDGILIGYEDITNLMNDVNELSLNSLLAEDNFQYDAMVVITDGDKVQASNNDRIVGLAVEDCPIPDGNAWAKNGQWSDRQMIRIENGADNWYGAHTLYRQYYLYAFYSSKVVFQDRPLILMITGGIYVIIGAFAWIFWQHLQKEKFRRMEREYHLVNAIGSIYRVNIVISLEDATWEAIIEPGELKKILEPFPNAVEMLENYKTRRVLEPYQEEFSKFICLETMEERLKSQRFIGFSYENVKHEYGQMLLIPDTNHVDGKLKKVILVIRDVTQQKKKEMAYQEELRRIAEEAKKANEAKSDFLRRMSHDVRTPINGIRGLVNIGRASVEDRSKVMDCFDKIMRSSDFLLDMVNNILNMSKLESGRIHLEEKSFDLQDLLDETNAIMESQAVERGLSFHSKKLDVEHGHLIGSPTHLQQIFQNIIVNAIKYNKENGSIVVGCKELSCDDAYALFEFTCEDTGIGMSEEFQKRAFDIFTQEHNSSRTDYEGTGIGLSIVKKLVDLMQGEIRLESEAGKGTNFTITMSFAVDQEYYREGKAKKLESDSLDGIHILVVEDNELNMEIAEFMLVEKGAVLTKARNGQEAVDTFRNSQVGEFDIVLMDIMMPVMDGLEAARQIRAMDREDAAVVPILAMSANSFDDDIQKSREAGMNEHLSKPLDAKKMVEMILSYINIKKLLA